MVPSSGLMVVLFGKAWCNLISHSCIRKEPTAPPCGTQQSLAVVARGFATYRIEIQPVRNVPSNTYRKLTKSSPQSLWRIKYSKVCWRSWGSLSRRHMKFGHRLTSSLACVWHFAYKRCTTYQEGTHVGTGIRSCSKADVGLQHPSGCFGAPYREAG